MKDFVAKVGRTYSSDDFSDIPVKCRVLEDKLASLLESLTLESKMAQIEQAVSSLVQAISNSVEHLPLNRRLVINFHSVQTKNCSRLVVTVFCMTFSIEGTVRSL